MDNDSQLKLQAYLDGELPEKEAKAVANWLAKDSEAVALFGELRNTRQALTGFEVGIALPESREFYWSKIAREIRVMEQPKPEPARVSLLAAGRRLLMPASAIAGVAFAALFPSMPLRTLKRSPHYRHSYTS